MIKLGSTNGPKLLKGYLIVAIIWAIALGDSMEQSP